MDRWTTPATRRLLVAGALVTIERAHLLSPAALDVFRGTVFRRLAFWEWLGSLSGFLFYAGGVLLLEEDRPPVRGRCESS